MEFIAEDPLTQLAFSMFENKGVYALLLGSGLSRAAEIPTGWEITLDLVRRIALAKGVEDQTDWAEWYRKTAGKEPNYSLLLEEISSSPAERRSILHGYIEPNDEDREKVRRLQRQPITQSPNWFAPVTSESSSRRISIDLWRTHCGRQASSRPLFLR
jgi:hypothetical protein